MFTNDFFLEEKDMAQDLDIVIKMWDFPGILPAILMDMTGESITFFTISCPAQGYIRSMDAHTISTTKTDFSFRPGPPLSIKLTKRIPGVYTGSDFRAGKPSIFSNA